LTKALLAELDEFKCERVPMPKKPSESSRPAKPILTSAESLWRKPLTKRQKDTLGRIVERQARGDTEQIDYSDIPALADSQLEEFRRAPRERVVRDPTS
jgi:hypothetical protein